MSSPGAHVLAVGQGRRYPDGSGADRRVDEVVTICQLTAAQQLELDHRPHLASLGTALAEPRKVQEEIADSSRHRWRFRVTL